MPAVKSPNTTNTITFSSMTSWRLRAKSCEQSCCRNDCEDRRCHHQTMTRKRSNLPSVAGSQTHAKRYNPFWRPFVARVRQHTCSFRGMIDARPEVTYNRNNLDLRSRFAARKVRTLGTDC